MSELTLYSYDHYKTPAEKILVAAKYSGVSLDSKSIEEAPLEVSAHPLGAIRNFDSRWPVLSTPEGLLFQTNAIARYVAASCNGAQLLGWCSREDAALINQWIDFCSGDLHLSVVSWVYPLLGFLQTSDEEREVAQNAVFQQLEILNSHLLTRTFLVNEEVTLADILIAMTLFDLYKTVMTEELCSRFQNVTRWFLTCLHEYEFQQVLSLPTFLNEKLVVKIVFKKPDICIYPCPVGEELQVEEDQLEAGEEEPPAPEEEEAAEVEVSSREIMEESETTTTQEVSTTPSPSQAISVAAQPRPMKKMTEKDLMMAFPSTFTPAPATKDKPHQNRTSPQVARAIQQPR